MKHCLLLLVLLCLSALIACRPGRPINTYTYDLPPAASRKAINSAKMRDIIVKSCVELGWQVQKATPGSIEASLLVRNKHTIVVTIPYTASGYSIQYKDSMNMEYATKKDGTVVIHPNYNNWTMRLDQAIRNKISTYVY